MAQENESALCLKRPRIYICSQHDEIRVDSMQRFLQVSNSFVKHRVVANTMRHQIRHTENKLFRIQMYALFKALQNLPCACERKILGCMMSKKKWETDVLQKISSICIGNQRRFQEAGVKHEILVAILCAILESVCLWLIAAEPTTHQNVCLKCNLLLFGLLIWIHHAFRGRGFPCRYLLQLIYGIC